MGYGFVSALVNTLLGQLAASPKKVGVCIVKKEKKKKDYT